MRSVFVMTLSLAFFALFNFAPANGCDCDLPKFHDEFNAAEAVFIGKVLNRIPGPDEWANVRVELEVHKAWKGVDQARVTVATPSTGPACGFNFQIGKTYLVYAHGKNLGVTLCSRTEELKIAKRDLPELEKLQAPGFRIFEIDNADAGAGFFWPCVTGIAVGVSFIAGVLIGRRTRALQSPGNPESKLEPAVVVKQAGSDDIQPSKIWGNES